MAFIRPWTPDDEMRHQQWVDTRPPVVQAILARLHPNKLYRHKKTGQRVTVFSVSEDGTITMRVIGLFNALPFGDRDVFGVDPDQLEECVLPNPDEEPLWSDTFAPDVVQAWYRGAPVCFLCGPWDDVACADHPEARVVKAA